MQTLKTQIRLDRYHDNLFSNYVTKSTLKNFEASTTSDMFSIKYVKTGEEFYTIAGKEYRVPHNCFIITNPDQELQINIDSKSMVEGLCFFFDKELIQQIAFTQTNKLKDQLGEAGINNDFILNENSLEKIFNKPIHSFGTSVQPFFEFDDYQQLSKQEITSLLMNLAEELVQHQFNTKRQLKQLAPTKSSTRDELYKRLQIGRQFMHDNLNKSISLKDIAKATCLSAYYFHRSFRCFFKMTPQQYLQFIRMQKAHEYLIRDYSKAEVADLCGFKDPKYFAKVYKKWRKTIPRN